MSAASKGNVHKADRALAFRSKLDYLWGIMAYGITILKDETQDGVRVVYAQPCREVCSQQIAFAVKDGIILEAAFAGGCSGNTQGICSLLRGMKVEEAVSRLEGIQCGGKGTSCPDQLARALRTVL